MYPFNDAVDYKIIRGNPADVETTVNELLDQGWVLHGALFPIETDHHQIVVQCMINMKEEVTIDRQIVPLMEKEDDETSKI